MPGWLLIVLVVIFLALVVGLCFYSEHVRRKNLEIETDWETLRDQSTFIKQNNTHMSYTYVNSCNQSWCDMSPQNNKSIINKQRIHNIP